MSNDCSEYKFIVDEMAGKLARFLRMLGYDTVYHKEIANSKLIEIALSEKRIILTRDTHLIEMKIVKDYFLVSDDDPEVQLKDVLKHFELNPDLNSFLSRCLDCNSLLEDISKESVEDQVWPYVYKTQNRFMICPDCKRIFWEGDHVRAMCKRLLDWGIGKD
jgi:uncharacterized protein